MDTVARAEEQLRNGEDVNTVPTRVELGLVKAMSFMPDTKLSEWLVEIREELKKSSSAEDLHHVLQRLSDAANSPVD